MTATDRLKPCPFCGAEAKVWYGGAHKYGLVEHNDGCLFPMRPKHEIPESDFERWNARVGLSEHDKAVLTAYTGIMLTKDFSAFHAYVEEKLGTSVTTLSFALRSVWDAIKEACKEDAMEVLGYDSDR